MPDLTFLKLGSRVRPSVYATACNCKLSSLHQTSGKLWKGFKIPCMRSHSAVTASASHLEPNAGAGAPEIQRCATQWFALRHNVI